MLRRDTIAQVTSTPAGAKYLRDLARLRRVRDRIDRGYVQPLDVEALARGAHMSAGHLSREFRRAYDPAVDPGITDEERRTIAEMMAKGTYASINLATADLDGTFERVQANAEVVQEPTEQPYGVRDCAVRDPAGNMVRIQQLR